MKRTFDILISAFLIIVLLPVFCILSILLVVFIGRPVFFFQVRPGLKAKPFKMVKFRTMSDLRDARGQLLPDDQRLTTFGRFLRLTSLDELPELFNVLRGDMSLVGPRPLLMEYLPLYDNRQRRRHEVKPGITGWAQVNGRNNTSWPDKFEMDVWYVENASMWLDFKILALTVWVVLRRDGVTKEGCATTDYFKGNE